MPIRAAPYSSSRWAPHGGVPSRRGPGQVRPVTTGEQAVGAAHHDPLVGGEPLGLGGAPRGAGRVRPPGAHPRREERVDEHPGHGRGTRSRRSPGTAARGRCRRRGVGRPSRPNRYRLKPPGATTGLVGCVPWPAAPTVVQRTGPTTLRGRPRRAHPARDRLGRRGSATAARSSRGCTPTSILEQQARPTAFQVYFPEVGVHRVRALGAGQRRRRPGARLGDHRRARARRRASACSSSCGRGWPAASRASHAADDAVDLDLEALAAAVSADAPGRLDALSAGTPAEGIIAAWTRLEATLHAAGVSLPASRTSTEVSLDVLRRYSVDPATLQTLADLYREARWSRHPLTEDDRERAFSRLPRARRRDARRRRPRPAGGLVADAPRRGPGPSSSPVAASSCSCCCRWRAARSPCWPRPRSPC